MNKEEFVRVMKLQTSDSAVSGTIKTLTRSAGRKPSERLVRMSAWHNQLGMNDQEMLREALKDAAESAVFSFLCILDGVRVIEAGPNQGELELYYVKDGKKTLLNDPHQEELHNLFNALRPPAETAGS
jgi:hypothetical protein